MNRAAILVATLSLAFPLVAVAQSATQTASSNASAGTPDLHSLMKNASSTPQYQQVAQYLHQRETEYRAKADAEKLERDRRAQVNAGLAQKYPRPVDSAQYLYESYLFEAETAAIQAKHYDQLAGAPKASPQMAAASGGKS